MFNLWVSTACFSSVQFSHSVVSDSLRPHEMQHTRLPCPSPIPGAYSNSCPLSRWCHPAILSSIVPFSSSRQSFPASGSFPVSQFFASGGQNVGISASAISLRYVSFPRLGKFSTINGSNMFSSLSPFLFWDPHSVNVSTLDVVSEIL